jgi:peptidyl-prolyl cis-trans isomerase C
MMRITKFMIILFLVYIGILIQDADLQVFAEQQVKTISAPSESYADDFQQYVQGEVLIKVHSDVSIDKIEALNNAYGMTILEKNTDLNMYRMKVLKSVENSVSYAESQPFIEYASPNYVLAEVGGEAVTLMNLESVIGQLPPLFRRQYATYETKKLFLITTIDSKIFANAAREEDLEKVPEVRAQIDAAVEKTLAQAYQRKIVENVSASEAELMDYYNDHVEDFQRPEQIRARQIVTKTEEEARYLSEKIKAGADFDKIARESSKHSTRKNGGDLGWISRGRMGPAFDKSAFALEKGEISNVVKTRFGYSLIKVEDRKEPEQLSFEEARERLVPKVNTEKQKKIISDKKQELRNKYGVIMHDDVLSKVKVQNTGDIQLNEIMQKLQNMIKMPRK